MTTFLENNNTRLSIIIVNYKSAKLILDCLASIYLYDVADVEIIIVDNDSKDDLAHLLKMNFSSVIFIPMGYNAGFARANNAGIRMAKGKTILLLNPDTINLHDAINACCQMLNDSAFVAAGVQLLNEDLSPQISGNYAMRGGLNYLLPLPYLGRAILFVAHLFKIKKPNVPNTNTTTEVDWINGAFLMAKKDAIEKAGLLDEDFFLYAEEPEWCSRLKKQGKLCIFGQLNVLHLQGETANTAFQSTGKGYYNLFDKKGLQIMLSNFVRIRKEFGVAWFLFQLMVYLFYIPIFFICLLVSTIFHGSKKAYTFAHAIGFSSNIFFVAKMTLTIIRNKPYFYKVL